MQKKGAAIALWAFSLPQMLKGCAEGNATPEGSEAMWVWLLVVALGVILLWEGAKAVVRPCLKAMFVDPDRLPVQATVNVDPGQTSSSQEDELRREQLPINPAGLAPSVFQQTSGKG